MSVRSSRSLLGRCVRLAVAAAIGVSLSLAEVETFEGRALESFRSGPTWFSSHALRTEPLGGPDAMAIDAVWPASAESFCLLKIGTISPMNLESIERGLDWLKSPKYLPGRLEMETQRGRRLELEIISYKLRVPIAGLVFKFPIFMIFLPAGSSPIHGTPPHSEHDAD